MGAVAFWGWDSVIGSICFILAGFFIGYLFGRWSKFKEIESKEKKTR